MDKNSNNKDEYLKHLNKISYKISKQSLNRGSLLPPPPPPPPPSSSSSQFQNNIPNQPPVYNINKSDFRDVVQRLTGSPAHERAVTPSPPLQPPSTVVKQQQSSRLHRIRPPPLAHLVNRPPPSLLNNTAVAAQHQQQQQQQQPTPLSPLPPLPTVHTAVESPVSAYMRYLHGTISSFDSDQKRFPGFSPRWSNNSQSQASSAAPGGSLPQFPLSPLSFGCLPMFSPTGSGGQLGFPLSPKLPAGSP